LNEQIQGVNWFNAFNPLIAESMYVWIGNFEFEEVESERSNLKLNLEWFEPERNGKIGFDENLKDQRKDLVDNST